MCGVGVYLGHGVGMSRVEPSTHGGQPRDEARLVESVESQIDEIPLEPISRSDPQVESPIQKKHVMMRCDDEM